MCNKTKFTKAFPLVDLIPFFGEGDPGATTCPFQILHESVSGCWSDSPVG